MLACRLAWSQWQPADYLAQLNLVQPILIMSVTIPTMAGTQAHHRYDDRNKSLINTTHLPNGLISRLRSN